MLARCKCNVWFFTLFTSTCSLAPPELAAASVALPKTLRRDRRRQESTRDELPQDHSGSPISRRDGQAREAL